MPGPAVSALVLVDNERTVGRRLQWKDVTGERYHYPNQYRNQILPDRPFVYYQSAGPTGGGVPGYFGVGRIGQIWADPDVPPESPKRRRRWYCGILDYRAFDRTVPARVDGRFVESIPPNRWRVPVRELPIDVFWRILASAGVDPLPGAYPIRASTADCPVTAPNGGSKPRAPSGSSSDEVPARGGEGPRGARWYPPPKVVGDRAEKVVLDHLRKELPRAEAATLRWVAAAGKTPGWDIEYVDSLGERVVIEVKGTQRSEKSEAEFTVNEWEAARELRTRYWLYLVADCFGREPRMTPIHDPARSMRKVDLSNSNVLLYRAGGRRAGVAADGR